MKTQMIEGRAIVIDGSDVDTDQILPARFMKTVVFAGIEEHLFEDQRAAFAKAGRIHPVDQMLPDSAILIGGVNFGCGSSREHAVQALYRRGIRAVFAVSFGDIFLGNCRSAGLAAVVLASEQIALLAEEAARGSVFHISLEAGFVRAGNVICHFPVDEGLRRIAEGSWDTLSQVLAGSANVEQYEAQRRIGRALHRQ